MDTVKLRIALRDSRRQGRSLGLLASQMLDRGTQQLAAIGWVRCAIGCKQLRRIARIQAVLADALEHGVLLVFAQRGERVRQRRRNLARGDKLFGGRRQARSDGLPCGHPAALATQQPRHFRGLQAVVLEERADHMRLVHRRRGARGSIDHQHQSLELGGTRRGLDDNRDRCMASLAPPLQAFESVYDLEGRVVRCVGARRHAQRQLSGPVRPRRHAARTQRGKARAQPSDGYELHTSSNLLGAGPIHLGDHLRPPQRLRQLTRAALPRCRPHPAGPAAHADSFAGTSQSARPALCSGRRPSARA